MSTQTEKIKELVELRVKARLGGGEKAIAKQHEKGKYTARERTHACRRWGGIPRCQRSGRGYKPSRKCRR